MAKPISTIKKQELTPEQKQEQELTQLMETLAENADGLKQTTKLLQELQDSGILPAIQAFLGAKEQVAALAVQQMTRPPATKMMNNAMAVLGALGSIDPEMTQKLLASVTNGLEHASSGLENNQSTSVWDLMKALSDPDINRGLTFGLNFLKGLGQGLQQQ